MIDSKIAAILGAISIAGSVAGYGTVYGGLNQRLANIEAFAESRATVPEALATLTANNTHLVQITQENKAQHKQFQVDIRSIQMDLGVIRALAEYEATEGFKK